MDKTIFKTTSGMVIYPYKKRQSPALEHKTSMRDFGCYHKWIETTGFVLDDMFVTYHLDDFFVKNEFPSYKKEVIGSSDYIHFDRNLLFETDSQYEITEVQYSVINQIMQDNMNTRWFIHCPQGYGKTFIAINIISKFRINTMIMCYSVKILDQWRKQMSHFTNFPMSRVLTLDSGTLITKILDGSFPANEYNIFLATPILLVSYGKKHGYDKINQLMIKLGIGLKIYDEAHRNLANMVKIDALSSVKYTLYLSGDFAQAGKYRTKLFYDMFRDVRIVRPEVNMVDLRYTDAVVVEYNTQPTAMDIMSMTERRGMSLWKFMDYQFAKGTIMNIIYWIIENILKLKELDRRILILTSKIEHCDYITEKLIDKFPDVSIGRYHGLVPTEESAMTKDNAHIIVATYVSFSTGIDCKNIKYVVSTSSSNRVEDSQASGRARPLSNGENAIFWMLIDTGFAMLVEKEKDRIDYLYNLKIRNVSRITYEGE